MQLNNSRYCCVSLTIQLNHQSFVYTQLNDQTVLFDPEIGPYQMLPLRARVNLGAMAMKGYTAFAKASAILEPHHQIVSCHIQDTH